MQYLKLFVCINTCVLAFITGRTAYMRFKKQVYLNDIYLLHTLNIICGIILGYLSGTLNYKLMAAILFLPSVYNYLYPNDSFAMIDVLNTNIILLYLLKIFFPANIDEETFNRILATHIIISGFDCIFAIWYCKLKAYKKENNDSGFQCNKEHHACSDE